MSASATQAAITISSRVKFPMQEIDYRFVHSAVDRVINETIVHDEISLTTVSFITTFIVP